MSTRKRMAILLAGGIALGLSLALTVTFLNGSAGFSACSGSVGCGWIVPLMAAILIGGVVWVLSIQKPVYRDDADMGDERVCSGCSERVLQNWRLCPSCGARLED